MDVDEERNGWLPDPFGRFEERYLVYGEPSRLVRNHGIEQTDREALSSDPPDPADGMDRGAQIDDPPVALDAAGARPRRVRARAVAAVAIVLAATLIVCLASAIRADRSANSTGDRATRPQADATIAARDTRSLTASASASAESRNPIAAWAGVLQADVNNINEVVYDYGQGTLEAAACRRTQNDAAKLTATSMSSDIATVIAIARDDIMTFATQCTRNFRASAGPVLATA